MTSLEHGNFKASLGHMGFYLEYITKHHKPFENI